LGNKGSGIRNTGTGLGYKYGQILFVKWVGGVVIYVWRGMILDDFLEGGK
jgi:hypothetical protein